MMQNSQENEQIIHVFRVIDSLTQQNDNKLTFKKCMMIVTSRRLLFCDPIKHKLKTAIFDYQNSNQNFSDIEDF